MPPMQPRDERIWEVHVSNILCPHVYYPANYHGCKERHRIGHGDDTCTYEQCPLRVH